MKNYNKITDLMQQISKIDQMIKLHSETYSVIMLQQYTSKKLELTVDLIGEIQAITFIDLEKKLYILSIFLNKYYSEKDKIALYETDDNFKILEEIF